MVDPGLSEVRRFALSTEDVGETEQFIGEMYAANRTEFIGARDGGRLSVDAAVGDELAAEHVRATVDYHAVCEPSDECVFLAPAHGRLHIRQGAEDRVLRAGEQGLFMSGVALTTTQFDLEVRTVRMAVARLEQTAVELGGVVEEPFAFAATVPLSVPAAQHWAATMAFANHAILRDDHVLSHPLLSEQLAAFVTLAALHTFPNTLMMRRAVPACDRIGSASLRRAEAFIDENAHRAITVTDIARAAGTTPRAVQHAFARHRDSTPMGYLRRVRLHRAHAELLAADPSSGTTVVEVARRWGFGNPSRFAQYYREAYGQPPSRTLHG